MNVNWSERTKPEKIFFILECLCTIVLAVCFVLMLMGKIHDNLFYLILGIDSALEGAVQWKRNHKMAILNFGAAVILVAICAATHFL